MQKAWRENGKPFINYEVKDGVRYGLQKSALCYTLKNEKIEAPTLIYYLERHIEVDSGEHGPLAMKCLATLTQNNEALNQLALKAGREALEMRQKLWDDVLISLS
jgi:hypothetical protein